jgi:hypothetical protein
MHSEADPIALGYEIGFVYPYIITNRANAVIASISLQ